MSIERIELKPCPFCGSKAVIKQFICNGCYRAACTNRHCPGDAHSTVCDTPEAAMAAWNQRIEPDTTRSQGGFISDFHNVLKRLETVAWRETAFSDLSVYYAESRVYAMRCKQNSPNEHLLIIKAGSEHEAISRAVFDLHKADEQIPAVASHGRKDKKGEANT